MVIDHVFTGISVARLEEALAWYERLMGRPPDRFPTATEAVWLLAGASSIYVVADPERAGRALLTLIVDDLAATVDQLAQRGLAAGATDEVPGLYRKAFFVDPEGNTVALGQLFSAGG